jgi:hypothetical protein
MALLKSSATSDGANMLGLLSISISSPDHA